MIELEMVRRMMRRGLLLAPVAIGLLGIVGGLPYAVSTATGIALTLGNLWIAGRIIGGLAENRPELLVAGGLVALMAGMALVTLGLVILRTIDYIDLTVAGLALIGAHLVVVIWEAADNFLKIDPARTQMPPRPQTRS